MPVLDTDLLIEQPRSSPIDTEDLSVAIDQNRSDIAYFKGCKRRI